MKFFKKDDSSIALIGIALILISLGFILIVNKQISGNNTLNNHSSTQYTTQSIQDTNYTGYQAAPCYIVTTFITESEYSVATPIVESENDIIFNSVVLSPIDIEMIAYVLANEVNNMDYHYKITVAEIIRNRLLSADFPNDIYSILHAENQFTAIDNYYNPKIYPDDDVYKAIEDVFNNETNVIDGAVFYRNKVLSDQAENHWWDTLKITYTYSQTLSGVDYTTTYYK